MDNGPIRHTGCSKYGSIRSHPDDPDPDIYTGCHLSGNASRHRRGGSGANGGEHRIDEIHEVVPGTYVRRLSTPPLVDICLPIGQEALERHDKVRTAGGEVGPFARVDAQVEEQ